MKKSKKVEKVPLISLKNTSKIYKMGEVEVCALQDINLDFFKGEFVAIVGKSGSGKSTMMNLIGCLDVPTSGNIYLNSKDIKKMSESELSTLRGKTIGFVFQQYHLIKTMNVFSNVKLSLDFQEIEETKANKTVEMVLKLVDLDDKKNNLPSQLSGGQQQRVSIARALAVNPDLILADEITGALDSVTGKKIMKILQDLWKKENKTIIMITHDQELAKYAQRIIELKDGKVINITINKGLKK